MHISVKRATLPPSIRRAWMAQDPEEVVRSFGATVRTRRVALGLTQQRAAKGAGVSLSQLALFERGENVSLLFLLKVARHLDLAVEVVAGSASLDVVEFVRGLDAIESQVRSLRGIAVEAALPASERATGNAAALREFVERHTKDSGGSERLTRAIVASGEREAPAIPRVAAKERRDSVTSRKRGRRR
jgi:transcriptional regulator with XRE-family HTH domain